MSAAAAQTGADTPAALLKEACTAVALLEEARMAAADGSMESVAFTGSAALILPSCFIQLSIVYAHPPSCDGSLRD
jgi:hypothetical protein